MWTARSKVARRFVLLLPTMTDYNDNKIDLDGQEESTPDGYNPLPATPTEGDAPAGNETLPADPPGTNQAVAVVGELPGSNPFAEMVGEVPLEAECVSWPHRTAGFR